MHKPYHKCIHNTNEFMAPALKLCATWGLFSRAKYTNMGITFPSTSLALESFPSSNIYTENNTYYIRHEYSSKKKKKD